MRICHQGPQDAAAISSPPSRARVRPQVVTRPYPQEGLRQQTGAEKDNIQRLQRRIIQVEDQSGLSVSEIKEINRRMSMGEARPAAPRKKWWRPTCAW